jgi:hypothetical protein
VVFDVNPVTSRNYLKVGADFFCFVNGRSGFYAVFFCFVACRYATCSIRFYRDYSYRFAPQMGILLLLAGGKECVEIQKKIPQWHINTGN